MQPARCSSTRLALDSMRAIPPRKIKGESAFWLKCVTHLKLLTLGIASTGFLYLTSTLQTFLTRWLHLAFDIRLPAPLLCLDRCSAADTCRGKIQSRTTGGRKVGLVETNSLSATSACLNRRAEICALSLTASQVMTRPRQ